MNMPRVQKTASNPSQDVARFIVGASGIEKMSEGPSREQIAHRAYELFLARGGEHGHDRDDWLQAERELRLGRFN
jgi:hypothetical protein